LLSSFLSQDQGSKRQQQDSDKKEGPDKTLRRLAQNREAARKSRLRKKAYVQQLESSRIRLQQLEQELQRARQQGVYHGDGAAGGAGALPGLNSNPNPGE
jgi:transcription factor TGA